jgi:hypothetical protein
VNSGVINVQHREARIHSGSDLEMLSTMGEQVSYIDWRREL